MQARKYAKGKALDTTTIWHNIEPQGKEFSPNTNFINMTNNMNPKLVDELDVFDKLMIENDEIASSANSINIESYRNPLNISPTVTNFGSDTNAKGSNLNAMDIVYRIPPHFNIIGARREGDAYLCSSPPSTGNSSNSDPGSTLPITDNNQEQPLSFVQNSLNKRPQSNTSTPNVSTLMTSAAASHHLKDFDGKNQNGVECTIPDFKCPLCLANRFSSAADFGYHVRACAMVYSDRCYHPNNGSNRSFTATSSSLSSDDMDSSESSIRHVKKSSKKNCNRQKDNAVKPQTKSQLKAKLRKTLSIADDLSAFILALIDMLNSSDIEKIITWNSEGTSIIIRDSIALTKAVLCRYFKHSNLSSFIRQLNLYGFRKVNPTGTILEFSNPDFVRHHPERFCRIRRLFPRKESKTINNQDTSPPIDQNDSEGAKRQKTSLLA